MTFPLIPIALFIVGLLLFVMPVGAKANRIGEILMFAGALGVALSTGHSVVIR
jgi:Na+/phosphate symporter